MELEFINVDILNISVQLWTCRLLKACHVASVKTVGSDIPVGITTILSLKE